MPATVWFRRINLVAVVACFVLVVVGAYVRLSDAGLGCPDWPGCYGQIVVPTASQAAVSDHAAYAIQPLVAPKAWKEMIHRYLAGFVGLLVVGLALGAFRLRGAGAPMRLALTVLGVIGVQIVFGALTVTWKVMPIIVTTHLLLGLTTLALLWWMWLRQSPCALRAVDVRPGIRGWAALALGVVALQIFLGGWTSTNYAAVACPDFPTCQASYGLQTALGPAFDLWHGLGINYEGGILAASVRATIHMVHRYGALLTTLIVGGLGLYLVARGRGRGLRGLGVACIVVLLLQLAIGIGFVEMRFPLSLADAHTGGAALLLLTVVSLNHFVWSAQCATEA
ncbi:MAG: heme A synthase [Nevskiaceae bacterium]|nr:MAG: heme A synthase [Nevskiaceae bacterium]TBR73157.1 MAG: heme A synthase [Nevskiaceae bacterium]